MTPRDLVTFHEGARLKVYDDATGHDVVPGYTMVGHPTIGTGRALDTHGISEFERVAMLDADLKEVTADVVSLFGGLLNSASEARMAAIVDMRFELGATGFRGFKDMIRCILSQDWHGAAIAAMDSDWARSKLTQVRALQDATMLMTGCWPAAVRNKEPGA